MLLETPDRPVRRFDFMDWTHEIMAETAAKQPVRQPWALQATNTIAVSALELSNSLCYTSRCLLVIFSASLAD